MSLISYMIAGIIVVFAGFVVLYAVFKVMELLTQGKKSRRQRTLSTLTPQKTEEPTQEKKQESDDTEIAVIGAVLSEVLSKPVAMIPVAQRMPRVYTFEERSATWRKSGWKGVRKWRASSGW